VSKPAQKQTYKPKSVDIFDMRKGTDKNGNEFRRVVFAKGVTLSYNGYEVDLGEYRSAFLKNKEEMAKDLDFLLKNEYIDEAKHDEQLARIEEKLIVGKVNLPLK
jgi:hypothetical protein